MDVLLRGLVLGDIAKLDPVNDLKIIHMPSKIMEASVNKGVVDAAFTWEPYVSFAELYNNARIIFDMNEAVKNYPWYVVAAMEDTIDLDFELMSKALAAHQKAVWFINNNPEASNAIIARAFMLKPLKSKNGEMITPEAVIAHARSRIGWSCQFNKHDRTFLQRLIDYSRKLGFLKKEISADEIIDRSVLGTVYK